MQVHKFINTGFFNQISFDFYVYSNTINDTLDLVVVDVDNSGSKKFNDKILVGQTKDTDFVQSYLHGMIQIFQLNFLIITLR